MSKKKIIRIALIAILLIIVILILCTFRKFIIIKRLQENVKEYTTRTNYHIKYIRELNGEITTFNYYKKDNKMAYFIESNGTKSLMYNNGERTDLFIETPEAKTVELNANILGIPEIKDYFAENAENDWETFILSIKAKVKKNDYNNQKCYMVKNFSFDFEKSEMYVEKDTGLMLKSLGKNCITDIEYEFDNVDDSIFVEPDISQYTLQN